MSASQSAYESVRLKVLKLASQLKIKRTSLTNSDEADFLIILLSRGIETPNGFQMLENETKATDIINIRYIWLVSQQN